MMVYRPKNINLEQVFHSVCEVLGAVAQKKNITLRCDVHPDLCVQADINMMNSLLQNLLSNALKFTASGGHVQLAAYQIDQQVRITVQDTGVGMTEKQVQNFIHRKPAKSYKGTDGEKGAGLGLILCRQFAEKNNGTIHLESTLEQGTTFTIHLPAHRLAS
jgi:signal transduction histidine kinase